MASLSLRFEPRWITQCLLFLRRRDVRQRIRIQISSVGPVQRVPPGATTRAHRRRQGSTPVHSGPGRSLPACKPHLPTATARRTKTRSASIIGCRRSIPPQPFSKKMAVPTPGARLSEKTVLSVIPVAAADQTNKSGAQRWKPLKRMACTGVTVPAMSAKTPATSSRAMT
jgi:hypothetical protein